MAENQLILVVEGTPDMKIHWKEIVTDYLKKIIRCFPPKNLAGQKLSAADVELSLVVFRNPGHACLVERSDWTRDTNLFLQWLSAISFTGGSFDEAAIGEGLSIALTMFPSVPGSQVHKHCILVGASNGVPTNSFPMDAETIAKTFAQKSISLSVISLNQLPKLRAIYDAGNPNSRATTFENPRFVVLVSENFKEAFAALKSPVENNSSATVELASLVSSTVPTPGMSQQGLTVPTPGMSQPLNVTNSSTTNMSIPQQTSGGAPDGWMPFWKGALYAWNRVLNAFELIKLEGSSKAMASEKLAAGFPEALVTSLHVSTDAIIDTVFDGRSEPLIFQALNQHPYLQHLRESNLCAVVELYSHQLLLSVVEGAKLLGYILPKGTFSYMGQEQQQLPPNQQPLQQQNVAGEGIDPMQL